MNLENGEKPKGGKKSINIGMCCHMLNVFTKPQLQSFNYIAQKSNIAEHVLTSKKVGD